MRNAFLSVLALVSVLLFVTACNKPKIDECRKACWNYNKVMFWDKVDQEVQDLDPAQAAVVRAKREKDYQEIQEREEDPGLLNCITSCQHDISKEQVTCMIGASTAAAQAVCIEP